MQKFNELDSLTFAAMLRQGAVQLGHDKKVINDLNVFPIPDGDTGDNMLMTLKAGCAALKDNMGTLSELASAASSGMLLGARGNSGVILSRIFAGLAKGLKDDEASENVKDVDYNAVEDKEEAIAPSHVKDALHAGDHTGSQIVHLTEDGKSQQFLP